ncbi:MAG: PIN domain-containing protein [Panacagrimonas sp.]
MVRLELWSGVRSDYDRKLLRAYEEVLPDLPVTAEVWSSAQALASRCRAAGVTAQATDLLIAACAQHHGIGVETADSDFSRILAV